jgi:hypothetical protein
MVQGASHAGRRGRRRRRRSLAAIILRAESCAYFEVMLRTILVLGNYSSVLSRIVNYLQCRKFAENIQKVNLRLAAISVSRWDRLKFQSVRNFSLKMRNQVSHPHSTTGKITILYILILVFLYEKGKQNIFDWMIASIPWI